MRAGRFCEISDLDRGLKSGVKPLRTNSLLNWRLTKIEIGPTFGAATAAEAAPEVPPVVDIGKARADPVVRLS